MSHGTGSAPTLYVQECTTYRPATAQETLAAARRAISQQFRRGHSMSSPKEAHEYLRVRFATLEHEVFCLVLLDLCVAHIYVQQQRRIAASPDS